MRISHIFTLVVLAASATTASAQTTYNIDLAGTTFSQPALTIAEGDTVVWTWVSGLHNVVSDDGLFTSGSPVQAPNTYTLTFDTAFLAAAPANGNVYNYHCHVHLSLGMTGAITVTTARPRLVIDNFVAGQLSTMTVDSTTPGALIGYAYSLTGPGPITLNAGPCGFVTASLSAPITLLPQINADGTGTAVLPATIPAGTSGVTVWVQALDLTNCQLSNGATMTIG